METLREDPAFDALLVKLSRRRRLPRALAALCLVIAAGTGTAVAVAQLVDADGFGEGY
jgi:hypothetical protein